MTLEEIENADIRVHDALGREITVFSVNAENSFTIDATNFDRGIYYLLIKTKEEESRVVKFIKQ